jgi:peptidyl-dipeptidase A
LLRPEKPVGVTIFAALLLVLAACGPTDTGVSQAMDAGGSESLTADSSFAEEDATVFINSAEEQLQGLAVHAARASWVYSNFITHDTQQIAADANMVLTARQVELATRAAKYIDAGGVNIDTLRKLNLLRTGIVMPAPRDSTKTAEQANLGAKLGGMYGKGEYCYANGACLNLGLLSDIMADSRDPDDLLETWNGWRKVSPPMKDMYARQVELANEGAQELGFADLGVMWRSTYDMPAEDFSAELDRLWGEVRPLYEALHCQVRAQLGEQYGTELVAQNEAIPAHLLGNMWAQDWSNLYPLLAPSETGPDYDLSAILKAQGYNSIDMVKTGEKFFSSLGFERLPATFWERSLFVEPRDRDVICHASAWDIDDKADIRIKMCIKVNREDFRTIHHELGHNYYQRAYKDQSFLFRGSANDGFHEAIGNAIALSITPSYLQKIGLLESENDNSGDIAYLMKTALQTVAFLPFGLMVDQWRWKVFAGEVGPGGYNELWWQLREQYQGVKAPNERPETAFDAGAKFHVPANTPYARYFLASILQFQFQRSLCEIAGVEGPLHLCSIYGSQAAGERLNSMLEMGRSQPWPQALHVLTGQYKMDATALTDYFAPLKTWLDEQNQGRQCGW